MAANNYFGFATGGTQYGSSNPTQASYTTGQTATGYAVQHSAQPYAAAAAAATAAVATPQRASQPSYETYQPTAHTTTTYPYAAAAAARQQQTTYDKTQTYYQAQVPYTAATDTAHYQTDKDWSAMICSCWSVVNNSKPAYSTTYNSRPAAATQKAQNAAAQSATSYMYATGASTGASTNYTSTYNNASSTTYSASMYVQQPSSAQQSTNASAISQASQAHSAIQSAAAAAASSTNTAGAKMHANNWMAYKKNPMRVQRPKMPPRPQQLHYCEVCKISCAGPQTYREHLEGQKHKKKEAAAKAGAAPPISRGGTTLRCELCDVTCTGSDAYAAHIRGAKHQKVVKLHTKLGKPIPSTEPQVLSSAPAENKTAEAGKGTAATKSPVPKKTGPPKVNFVSAGTMKTVGVDCKAEAIKEESEEEKQEANKIDEKEIQPVGQDYIEEIKSDEGKVISFQCKLCECRFNDPNAKEMHMKGRRHRLQYKKKVNPDLVVDIKPSMRQRKIQEDRFRRQQIMDDLWKRRHEEQQWREEMRIIEEEERIYWEERRRYEEEMEYYEWHRRFGQGPRMGPPIPPPMPPRPYMGPMGPSGMAPSMKKPDSVDDRHVISKHKAIYPKEEELNAVQKIITNSEKALKLVSDYLTEKDAPKNPEPEPPVKVEEPATDPDKKDDKSEDSSKTSQANQPYRVLKGVMRVGVLAKGLVLTGDLKVQLVVMCAEKPTRTLLERVIDNLPKQLESVAPEDKYEVKRCVEEAAILVTSLSEPKITVTVTLTSPVMRDSNFEGASPTEHVKDPPDVLDRQKCLEALAALRHAKWFQARASGLQSCVMVIRILRDLCQRVPTWGHLNGWAMELLVEKVLSSSGQVLSPGDALRRIFEAIASGILLPGSSGLVDPCEKEPTDATLGLTNQEREDITASAQHALRLIAFRQIHKVLGMDALPPPKFTRGPFPRKRRRENVGEGSETDGGRKKDKKEEEAKGDEMETAEVNKA